MPSESRPTCTPKPEPVTSPDSFSLCSRFSASSAARSAWIWFTCLFTLTTSRTAPRSSMTAPTLQHSSAAARLKEARCCTAPAESVEAGSEETGAWSTLVSLPPTADSEAARSSTDGRRTLSSVASAHAEPDWHCCWWSLPWSSGFSLLERRLTDAWWWPGK
eukprot:2240066-Prymnesium_polylepis.1